MKQNQNIQQRANSVWTFTEKFTFRLCFAFFILYIFPFPLNSIPFSSELTSLNQKIAGWYNAIFDSYNNIWHWFVSWIGKHVLHLSYPIVTFTNGSGDTTYDYVLLLVFIVISLIAALIWTIFDRKRQHFIIAFYWLRVLVRYYLAVTLFGYGFGKVFHLQMNSPFLFQLIQPFGDKSPMGLAWSFVGYSKAYSAFIGWGEIVGGCFLFFRRTTTFGALFSMVVLGNIVALNFCYDIPVKLYSSVLFLMSVFLAAPDLRRLLNVFIFNRATRSVKYSDFVHNRRNQIIVNICKSVFILYTCYNSISQCVKGQVEYGDKRKLPPLYGLYSANLFVRNKDTILPLTTDTTRWKQLIIEFDKDALVKFMNDKIQWINFNVDTAKHMFTFYSSADTVNKGFLSYKIDSSWLTLTGKLFKDSAYIRLKKIDASTFNLVNRGFHWINEYPLNQ